MISTIVLSRSISTAHNNISVRSLGIFWFSKMVFHFYVKRNCSFYGLPMMVLIPTCIIAGKFPEFWIGNKIPIFHKKRNWETFRFFRGKFGIPGILEFRFWFAPRNFFDSDRIPNQDYRLHHVSVESTCAPWSTILGWVWHSILSYLWRGSKTRM